MTTTTKTQTTIKKGDRVTLRPRWMDSPTDNYYPLVALEDEDGGRVLVQRQVPGMAIWPCERMRVYMLAEGTCEHVNVSTTGNDVCDDCGSHVGVPECWARGQVLCICEPPEGEDTLCDDGNPELEGA